MKIDVHHTCADAGSYRAARVKSLFNVESGAEFRLQADLPLEARPWAIGIVVGPSGSGKTSVGRAVFGPKAMWAPRWPSGAPVIDAIAPTGPFDAVPAALSAVGLGSVPAWLRPYRVLSQGEQFRASLARLVCEAPKRAVVDEFTSVVDRQIAQVGALAFGKAWRRTGGQCVLLSCHYDVLDWLQPDWVFDTATGRFSWGSLWRRPQIELAIEQTDGAWWPLFEPHHYLKLPRMVGASYYVGLVNGLPVAHLAVSTRPGLIEARACRLVVMPEWQGAGVGMRFLNAVCAAWLAGRNRYAKPMRSLFHTSHPGLAAALRRDPDWTQVSGFLVGSSRARCAASILRSGAKLGFSGGGGYGGHFRAVQGFRYLGGAA
ncbi:MAG: ABC transporter ATP-binding protein [Ramlibacter sp.]